MKMLPLACLLAAISFLASHVTAATLYDIPLKDIDGKETSLKAYSDKVLLVVNVASKCGYTPQYKGLEAVHRKYSEKGFAVLGFPSNDFGNQEPGSNAEIKDFCSLTYHVTFPMFDKVGVKPGSKQHPLYTALAGKGSPFPGDVKWNFGKFLIGRDGKILARFDSADEPEGEKVTKAIENALSGK